MPTTTININIKMHTKQEQMVSISNKQKKISQHKQITPRSTGTTADLEMNIAIQYFMNSLALSLALRRICEKSVEFMGPFRSQCNSFTSIHPPINK